MSTDVLIIGGGIIGGSIAYALARAGASVAIYDAGVLGGEASWAGAGMLVPGSEYEEPSEACTLATTSLALWPQFASDLQEFSGEPIDFRICGSLELASTAEHWETLQNRAAAQRAWGMRNQLVHAAALRQTVPALAAHPPGAIYYPDEGQVDSRTVITALRAAFRRLNVVIHEHTPIVHIEATPNHVRAKTAGGKTIHATTAALSAGAWSSLIPVEAQHLPPVYPVKGHLAGYNLAPGTLPHVLRCHHTYVVQRNNGYTIAGTSEEHAGFDRTINPALASDIASRAAELVPGLLQRSPSDVWTGFRPGSPAAMPYMDRWQDTRLWLAYGHFRNGILLAPATAQRIANQILTSTC